MGVKHLWNIIDDARGVETLACMRGKTISVDLSIWIVEATQTLQFKSSVKKPHLRNLFFRILYLRRLGVKLIFVTEGDPPDLKQDVMKRRVMNKYGTKIKAKGHIGRSRFQRTIDECTRMLDLIGIPHVRAQGEAEAMCAALSKSDLTDGCLTNDGDFFLYGGKKIYRDFGINPKDQSVLVYTADEIAEHAGLDRIDMIGLALLNGCDYTEGLSGVGVKTVSKFLQDREFSEDLLVRFQQWIDDGYDASKYHGAEALIVRKAKKCQQFWNDKVIDEFLVQRDNLNDVMQKKMKFKYPHICDLQKYLLDQLEWPEDYSLPKILQLATSTYLEKLSESILFPVPIQPTRVLKAKCQQGVPLVDVEWTKSADENITYGAKWENCPDTFVTLENQQVVTKMLPDLLEKFVKLKESKKKGVKKTKKSSIKDPISTIPQSGNHTTCTAGISLCRSLDAPIVDSNILIQTQSLEGNTFDCSQVDERAKRDVVTNEEIESESDEEEDFVIPSLSERLSKVRLATYSDEQENRETNTRRFDEILLKNKTTPSQVSNHSTDSKSLDQENVCPVPRSSTSPSNEILENVNSITYVREKDCLLQCDKKKEILKFADIVNSDPVLKPVMCKSNQGVEFCTRESTPVKIQNKCEAKMNEMTNGNFFTPGSEDLFLQIPLHELDSYAQNVDGDNIYSQNPDKRQVYDSKQCLFDLCTNHIDNKKTGFSISTNTSIEDIENKLDEGVLFKETPPCFAIDTPYCEETENHNLQYSQKSQNYETELRRRLNLSVEHTDDVSVNDKNTSLPSKDIESDGNDTPTMSLSERLKLKLRKS